MSTDVDYYDVQAMIRDARSEIRGEMSREVTAVREYLLQVISDLREELNQLDRVLNARTEHLI